MAQQIASLVKKYSNPKLGRLSVASIEDSTQKKNMAVLLENQFNYKEQMLFENDGFAQSNANGGTSVSNIDYNASQGDKFKPIALALVRRTMPELMGNNWVAIQALQSPVGLAYGLRWLDQTTKTELFTPGYIDQMLGYSAKKDIITQVLRGVSVSAPNVAAITAAIKTANHRDLFQRLFIFGVSATGNIQITLSYKVYNAIQALDSNTGADGSSDDDNFAEAIATGLGTLFSITPPAAATANAVLATTIDPKTLAVDTATGEDWKVPLANDSWADPFATDGAGGANTEIPQVGIKLETTPIFAKTRKLAASFSLENAQDLQAMNGLDLHREMVEILHAEMGAEIDRETLWRVKKTAVTGDGGVKKVISIAIPDVTGAATTTWGRYSAELIDTLVKNIVFWANDIYRTTRRGKGNFVVVSPGVASALSFAPGFTQANSYKVNIEIGRRTEVGKMAEGITVYMDADSKPGVEYALVGFKGAGNQDAGVIFSPYVMGLKSEATSPTDFSPRIGVMSRYAFTDNLLGSGRYYRYIEFTGFANLGISGGYEF